MRPIGKTNVFKHSKNKYSSGGKTWNCSLWKKWLYEGNGEPGVQSKKQNVGFPLVESLRSWQESAKVPLKLWLAPPCEVAANQEDPLKMALHHHPNVVKPCYTVRYSCRFPSLSADGWKHCASFQLWHFILGCHDFLRNNRHSIKKTRHFHSNPLKENMLLYIIILLSLTFLTNRSYACQAPHSTIFLQIHSTFQTVGPLFQLQGLYI